MQKFIKTILMLALLFAPDPFVLASTIDNANSKAWASDAGWVNFSPAQGGVSINSGVFSGKAWSENYGWINLGPAQSGIRSDNNGNLSGSAWAEDAGWINFAGVSVDCNGQFLGTASSDNMGTLNFSCANCKVLTDWRPGKCGGTPPCVGAACVPTVCGDRICGPGETCVNCPGDCGQCLPVCGDHVCNGTEACANCPGDCNVCSPTCGDGSCQSPESCSSCPSDCGQCPTPCVGAACGGGTIFTCGDKKCGDGETCVNCPEDCGECTSICGDKVCNGQENCRSCPQDCGICQPVCGDGFCNGNETCKNCPQDCQVCTPVPPPSSIIPPVIGKIATPIAQTTVITGLAVPVSVIVFSPDSLSEMFLLPFRLSGLLLTAFGLKRRRPPWGIVYDSVTKRPLDPARVLLGNMEGKLVESATTDMDGRYGFLAKPGIYRIFAQKSNYFFPSKKLFGKQKDEIYENLYFGENIEIKKDGEVIIRNIPMDPLKFDWNEFAKNKGALLKFYSRWEYTIRRISDDLFILGFIIAIIATIVSPYLYNILTLCLYVGLAALKLFGLRSMQTGNIIEKSTGEPLSFAVLRVVMPGTNIEISRRVADKYGRYYCLVPKGKYYVVIDKKNADETYSNVYTSPLINTSGTGIIKKRFKV